MTTPTRPAAEEARTGLGLPIAIFASAQFVMVLDSSVMNVSLVARLDRLGHTVTLQQAAPARPTGFSLQRR